MKKNKISIFDFNVSIVLNSNIKKIFLPRKRTLLLYLAEQAFKSNYEQNKNLRTCYSP